VSGHANALLSCSAEGAIGDDVYAAILGMVLATTILAPFLIKAVFGRDVEEHTPGESV
jgi:hypothetical protein